MIVSCPYCDADNIEGIDECEACGQPLSDMHLHVPASAVERALLKDRVGSLGPREPLPVPASAPVGEVLQKMVAGRVGCVVVVDKNRPVGIFTERDALMKLNTDIAQLRSRPVSEFMTVNPESLQTNAKVAFAVQRMDLGGFRHVPIVSEEGQLQGIISVRDILRYLTDQFAS